MDDNEIPMDDPLLDGDVIENDDGSAEVVLPDEPDVETGFGDNLVKKLKPQLARNIAGEFIDLIEKDKEARKKRDEQYAEGIKRSGLGNDAPGGAEFVGASRVVHPMLAEACVDFEARAIRELMPSSGPVRTSIIGGGDKTDIEAAEIKRDILNLQLTRLIPEYRDETESLLSQLPMGGSQYKKWWFDGKRKRVEFVPIDDVYLPFAATNFYTATRVTHAQRITRMEFERRVESGLYEYNLDTLSPTESPETSEALTASDKVEGRESSSYNEDGLRLVYEVYAWYDFEDIEDETAPYILHIDESSGSLLGVYRNWEEGDEDRQKLDWMVEYGFVPWRGAYKIGLPHLIGSLSGAATGALRALLDSAHAANAPTLLKLKAGRMVGQTTEVAVTQVQEIEGPAGIDDIRKIVSPIPFAGPNPVLFELLGVLVSTGKGVVATAEEKIADASNNMPVGTSLALIEQGSKVFAAIHQRLHHSQAKELEVLCRLNAQYPETEKWEQILGKPVDPSIFRNTDDIIPVSDPNIFSEAQRFAQMQAVMQLMADPTVPYNRIEAHSRMLRLLNVPNPEQLLPKPPEATQLDAVEENMVAVKGTPLKAFPEQDHLAHIEVHLRFILNPMLGGGPAYAGPQLAGIMQHCTEHLTMHYPQMIEAGRAAAIASGNLLPDGRTDADNSVAAHMADTQSQQLQQIMQMWGQAQQMVGQKMPQPPMDPQAQVAMQVAQMEDARAKMQMQADQQTTMAKMQFEGQKAQAEMGMKAAAQQHQQQMDMMKIDMDGKVRLMEQQMQNQIAQLQQQVEMAKNNADNQQHQMTELLKNRDDNQTQLMIAQLKEEFAAMTAAAQPEAEEKEEPEENDTLKEMQRLLGEIEKAKTNDALAVIMEGLRATMAQMAAPKMFVRDKAGRPVGIQAVV